MGIISIGMGDENLLLDPQIRDSVVIPLVVMVILVGIGRTYVQQLMKSEATITADKVEEMKNKGLLGRSQRLRRNGCFISEESFRRRKAYLVRKKTGALRKEVPGAANPMSNPMAMVDMMKGNVTFMVPNMVMMTFCSYFFNGFICLKVPFAMPSTRFKLMLQRGVDLDSLDPSYVSSVSWYFLVTFGMNGVLRLLMGRDVESEEQRMMQSQMGGMAGMGGPAGFDAASAFRAERSAVQFSRYHHNVGEVAESEMLGRRYRRSRKDEKNTFGRVDLGKFAKKKAPVS